MGYKFPLLDRVIAPIGDWLDHKWGWDKLPAPVGLLALAGLRVRLRQRNLYDTGVKVVDEKTGDRWLRARTVDGTHNDLEKPGMGSKGSRFGRNMPLQLTYGESEPEIMIPSPRIVSTKLLTRDELIPATGANVLVAAWLQFEVHDWFSHMKQENADPWQVPVEQDDPWHEKPMPVSRVQSDPDWDSSGQTPATYLTDDSHWWDGSQIYGSTPQMADLLRADDGRLRLGEDGFLPKELEEKVDLTGVAGNFWIGLGVLHVLFMREHNAIVDMLQKEHPSFSEQRIYDTARLINAALMAKIHTVEWTPAVIAHPTTVKAMNVNWWGFAGEGIRKRFGRLSSSDLISGIPGSKKDHHGVPYSLTEEFVAVYRMHPLLPDDYTFRSHEDGRILNEHTFPDLGALQTRTRIEEYGLPSTAYSLGRDEPGIVCLHNFPRFLQRFERPGGEIVDLAAIDILRSRELGVPRYNEFRRLLRMKAPSTFDELTNNPQWARQLEEVYDGDIEKVDLTVGNFAEPLPKGFAFSDTAFRIFVLMASRRLQSDRFFTTDYRPEIYTEEGLDWVHNNTFVSVLLRHYPELKPALAGVANGFASWNDVST